MKIATYSGEAKAIADWLVDRVVGWRSTWHSYAPVHDTFANRKQNFSQDSIDLGSGRPMGAESSISSTGSFRLIFSRIPSFSIRSFF